MLVWAHQLEDLGKFLKEDPILPDNQGSETYQHGRRLIQNNLDACRYTAPLLTAFSRFVIPLAARQNNSSPPRQLKVVERR